MNTRFNKFVVAAALLTSFAAVIPAQAQTSMSSNPADIALAAEVKAALLKATPFQDNGVDVKVTAMDGKVNLSGWVTYVNDPAIALRIASSVNGVKQVTANLRTWSTDDDYRI